MTAARRLLVGYFDWFCSRYVARAQLQYAARAVGTGSQLLAAIRRLLVRYFDWFPSRYVARGPDSRRSTLCQSGTTTVGGGSTIAFW